MRDGPDDPFDGVVFDDDFVRSGRREQSAEERLAQLQRIAHGNRRAAGWRGSGPVPAPVAPRRRRTGRGVVLALVLVAGVVAGFAYLDSRAGEDAVPAAQPAGAPPVTANGDVPTQVGPAPGASPATPQRLMPLPPHPGGDGGYRFLDVQEDDSALPIAYDPCRPLRYVVRRAGEPPGGEVALAAAVREISAATGLVFERGPDTDEAPSDRRAVVQPERYGDAPVPVLVAWSDERESPDLAGYIAGYAGSAAYGSESPRSWRYVTGQVVLDAEDGAALLREPAGAAQLRSTIVHELGHLVGLNHVADRDQIMFSEGGDNRLELGLGDRRGLHALGSGQCFTDWAEFTPALR